jgi:hypothetical protein
VTHPRPPKLRFRLMRMAGRTPIAYLTEEARDAAAARWAAADRQSVMLEEWSTDRPQDDLHPGWSLTGAVLPSLRPLERAAGQLDPE